MYLLLTDLTITFLGGSHRTNYTRGSLVTWDTLDSWVQSPESYYCSYILDTDNPWVYELGPRGFIVDSTYPSNFGLTHMLAFTLILSADVSTLVKYLSVQGDSTGDHVLSVLIQARLKGDL